MASSSPALHLVPDGELPPDAPSYAELTERLASAEETNLGQEGFCACGCGGVTSRWTQTNRRLGRVKGERARYLKGHHRRLKTPAYVEEDRGYETPCWIWQRAIHGNGYGKTTVDGRGAQAHRVFYEVAKGSVPKGLELDHLCRVRSCVNPEHLEPVTRAVNTQRGNATPLTADDAAAIRASDESARILAERFGVTRSTIYKIRNGRRWAK